ncbi:MAG: MMPL family transporter, partial [Desulfuromonadales bacterium]|nr:MMPL family transporter [Desulfuromonadales bacterium]
MVILFALVSVCASLYVSFVRLSFSTDRTQLLEPGHPIQKSYGAFRAEFGGNDDLVVLVTGKPDLVRPAVDQLGAALTEDRSTFRDVLYQLKLKELTRHSLYFLSLADLNRLEEQVAALEFWIPELNKGIPNFLKHFFHAPNEKSIPLLKLSLPILNTVLKGILRNIETRAEAPYESPIPKFVPELEVLRSTTFDPRQTTFYNAIGKESSCMLLARPAKPSSSFASDRETIAKLRQEVSRASADNLRVNFEVSGEPVINTDEMVGARNDALKCSLTALILVSLIMGAAFADLVRPLCAVAALLVGLSWSFAFAALTVGTLNLLTVHFATILMGLSMTFAIQLLSHYQ